MRMCDRGGHMWGALVKGLKYPSVAQNETADKIESGSAIELDV